MKNEAMLRTTLTVTVPQKPISAKDRLRSTVMNRTPNKNLRSRICIPKLALVSV